MHTHHWYTLIKDKMLCVWFDRTQNRAEQFPRWPRFEFYIKFSQTLANVWINIKSSQTLADVWVVYQIFPNALFWTGKLDCIRFARPTQTQTTLHTLDSFTLAIDTHSSFMHVIMDTYYHWDMFAVYKAVCVGLAGKHRKPSSFNARSRLVDYEFFPNASFWRQVGSASATQSQTALYTFLLIDTYTWLMNAIIETYSRFVSIHTHNRHIFMI